MSIVIHSLSAILIVLVVSWLIYYARHKHDPIDVEKTYMLVGCLIGAVIGILCGMYLIDSVALGIGLGMLIGMMIGITVPKIKKKERTWQQK